MRKNVKQKTLQGFSLLEVVLTIALILLMGGLLFPTTIHNIQKSQVNSYASQLKTDIRYQQQRARNKNIATGIHFKAGEYILFDGENFTTSTERDVKKLPDNIRMPLFSLTNGNSILFPAGEFKPTSYGNITLSVSGYSTKVSINMEGLVENE
ncbi:MAG TPA: hypothetical protein VJY47_03035 [Candidatus Dojkabacteria bacterium]|nr:hypothetical protein [Candidatus Dojkabacteria bacterium]